LSLNVLQTGSTWHCTASRVGSLTEKEADLAYWKFCVFGERRAANSCGMAIRAPTEDSMWCDFGETALLRMRRRYFGWDGATSVRRRSERTVASFSFSVFVAIVAWPHQSVVSNKTDLCAV
jgi:hypothetical protein